MHLTAYLSLLTSLQAASTAWPGDHLTGQHCAFSVIEQWVWRIRTLQDFCNSKTQGPTPPPLCAWQLHQDQLQLAIKALCLRC